MRKQQSTGTFVTTLPAPTVHPSPMLTPGRMMTLPPCAKHSVVITAQQGIESRCRFTASLKCCTSIDIPHRAAVQFSDMISLSSSHCRL